jgi:hypothetical protein
MKLFTIACGILLIAATPAQQPAKRAPAGPGTSVAAAEAFKSLNALNEAKKLVVTFMGATRYSDLRAEHCFGWRFAGGLRILAESGGEYYGLNMSTVSPDGVSKEYHLIGVLYAEGPFLLERKPFRRGAYVIYSAPDELRVDRSIQEDVRSTLLPLKNKLDEPLFGKEKGGPAPRFSFTQEGGHVYLVLGSNKFRLSPSG